MLGTASKYFASTSLLLLVAAVVYGIGTGVDGSGDVALFGTALLATTGVTLGFLAFVAMEAGDGTSEDRHREGSYELVPAYWPLMVAVGIGVVIIGLVIHTVITIAGLVLIGLGALEWTLTAWADHRSTNAADNYTIRHTLATPVEVPVYGVLLIAVPVILISRILLAVSRNGASWIALAMATVVLIGAFVLYAYPNARKAMVTVTLAAAVVALIVGGIVAAAIGERDVEHHEGDDTEHAIGADSSASAPHGLSMEIG